MLKKLKRAVVRNASQAIVGGFRPPESPLTSWFGKVLVATAEETWPMSNGTPMMPLCQFNLTECPFVPELLSDIAFLTVFIDGDELPQDPSNGEGWLLRAYHKLDDLVAIQGPTKPGWSIRSFPIKWQLLQEDYPSRDDLVDIELPPEVDENYSELFENQNGTKIGGWPTLI